MTTTPLPPLPDHVGRVTSSGVFTFVGLSLMGGGKVYTGDQMQAYATAARADLEAENQRLRTLLAEAADDIESWGAYASDYFQQKHNLQGCVAKYRASLEKQP